MTRAERYLEKEAEFQKRDWEQHLPTRRVSTSVPSSVADVDLRESHFIFQERLLEIFREWGESKSQLQKGSHFDIDFSHVDSGSGSRHWSSSVSSRVDASPNKPFVVAVVGGSEQLKTTTLNSLFKLFGFNWEGQRRVLDADLLPTHSGNGGGLPLPIRLEYGTKFELVLERWTSAQLECLMKMVASKTKRKEWGLERRYYQLPHGATPTFAQFVSKHWKGKSEDDTTPQATQILQADGKAVVRRFQDCVNPSADAHRAVFASLAALVLTNETWFAYKRVTLRCPAEFLRLMGPSVQMVDLPGIGAYNGNMEFVEELVVREVIRADAVMVFSQPGKPMSPELFRVLGRSLFPRLCNFKVVPPPSVALINSESFASMSSADSVPSQDKSNNVRLTPKHESEKSEYVKAEARSTIVRMHDGSILPAKAVRRKLEDGNFSHGKVEGRKVGRKGDDENSNFIHAKAEGRKLVDGNFNRRKGEGWKLHDRNFASREVAADVKSTKAENRKLPDANYNHGKAKSSKLQDRKSADRKVADGKVNNGKGEGWKLGSRKRLATRGKGEGLKLDDGRATGTHGKGGGLKLEDEKSRHLKDDSEKTDWEQWISDAMNHWNDSVGKFLANAFSDQSRKRSQVEVKPSVFAHNLAGFIEMGNCYKGNAGLTNASVAALVGYIFQLTQERSISLVRQVLAKTTAYRTALDDVWKATIPTETNCLPLMEFRKRRSTTSMRLRIFEKVLGYKLSGSRQRKMFGWEDPEAFTRQMSALEQTVDRELCKIRPKFLSLKGDFEHVKLRQQAPQLLKQLLLDLAASWDSTAGRAAFESFVGGAGEVALHMFKIWVPKLFHENPWVSLVNQDPCVHRAEAMLLKLLKAKVPDIISSSAIRYTLTDSYCQLVRNLDTRVLLGLDGHEKRGSPGNQAFTLQLWSTFKNLVLHKSRTLQDLVEKHVVHPHQSQHVKELVERLKHLMTEVFRDGVNEFMKLSDALQGASLGAKEDTGQPPLSDCSTTPCISSVVDLQKALQKLEKQIKGYLEKEREARAKLGSERLNALQIASEIRMDPEPLFRKRKKCGPIDTENADKSELGDQFDGHQGGHSHEQEWKKCRLQAISPALSSNKAHI